MTSQPQPKEREEFRVVDAKDGGSPSSPLETFERARECLTSRHVQWPEDGPQKIQKRTVTESPWVDIEEAK